jgi:hypothetical protein
MGGREALRMTITIRGDTDETLTSVKESLLDFETQHPHAQIDLYRRNSISIRIRVVDPGFAGLRKSDRHALVWKHLEKLPDEIQGDISMVVLLAPGEEKHSLGNLEFEDPSPSLIK